MSKKETIYHPELNQEEYDLLVELVNRRISKLSSTIAGDGPNCVYTKENKVEMKKFKTLKKKLKQVQPE